HSGEFLRDVQRSVATCLLHCKRKHFHRVSRTRIPESFSGMELPELGLEAVRIGVRKVRVAFLYGVNASGQARLRYRGRRARTICEVGEPIHLQSSLRGRLEQQRKIRTPGRGQD